MHFLPKQEPKRQNRYVVNLEPQIELTTAHEEAKHYYQGRMINQIALQPE